MSGVLSMGACIETTLVNIQGALKCIWISAWQYYLEDTLNAPFWAQVSLWLPQCTGHSGAFILKFGPWHWQHMDLWTCSPYLLSTPWFAVRSTFHVLPWFKLQKDQSLKTADGRAWKWGRPQSNGNAQIQLNTVTSIVYRYTSPIRLSCARTSAVAQGQG